MRVPYYVGDLQRDPSLENYPCCVRANDLCRPAACENVLSKATMLVHLVSFMVLPLSPDFCCPLSCFFLSPFLVPQFWKNLSDARRRAIRVARDGRSILNSKPQALNPELFTQNPVP